MKIRSIAAALFTLVLCHSAFAGTFRWSYTFQTGEMAFGTIIADKGKTHLVNITDGTYSFRSADGRTNDKFWIDVFGSDVHSGWPVIPVNGSTDGLLFFGEQDLDPYDAWFRIGNGRTFIGSRSYENVSGYSGPEMVKWDEYNDESYILYNRTEESMAGWKLYGVPEGGATALLLGLGVLGLGLAFRRR